jgi:UPF0042 nucleotide-binding protein
MTAQRIVFVTGMSGGGKLTAVRALEDSGFFCIDNLPVPVIPKMLDLLQHSAEMTKLAIVFDAREKKYLGEAPKIVADARARGLDVQLLFLEASDVSLIRRFSETRRRHPLAPDGTVPEGIAAERALLADLRAIADEVIDTSATTVHELKHLVQERFGSESVTQLNVTVTSFGYRYGLPPQADIVLDVRFLPNPYFVPDLRALPGTSLEVSRWVLDHQISRDFLARAAELLTFLLPRYRDEGKAYLTVGVKARVRHRDVDRE